MRRRGKATGIAPRGRTTLVARYRARFKPYRRVAFSGPGKFALAIVIAALAALWAFGRDQPFRFALPPDPVVAHFVGADFSHEQRSVPSAENGMRNISRFTLTLELRNNTNRKITARSADLYDQAGYFLFSCRITSEPRAVAPHSVEELRCSNEGRLSRERVEQLLGKICEIDINLAGRGLKQRIHPVPWPRREACVS